MKKGIIKDAKIYSVFDIWKRKPRMLAFNDTDVIIIKVKSGEKEIKEIFFTCIKADGTFCLKTPSRTSRARREKLAAFLRYYFKTKEPEKYNLKERIEEWKDKEVEVETIDKTDYVYVP